MSRLLVVAASGLAREALAVERMGRRFNRIRVLDEDEARWGEKIDGEPIVGGLELAMTFSDHYVLVCAVNGRERRRIVKHLDTLGVAPGRYVGVVHPGVRIPEGCRVGRGTIVLENVVLTANVRLGDFVVAMPQVTLGPDDLVDDFATLCAGATLAGGVHVGEAAYVGMNACVSEGVTISPEATLGMGSALLEDLPAGDSWSGVPARPNQPVPALVSEP